MLQFEVTENGFLQKVRKEIYGRATFVIPDFKTLVEAKTNAKEVVKVSYVLSPIREDYLTMIKDFSKVKFVNIIDGTFSNYTSPLPINQMLSDKEELEKWQRQSYRIVIQIINPIDPTFSIYLYTVNGLVKKIGK